MTDLFKTALEVQRFFKKNRWEFCIIGGIALQRWGEPRLTKDIDISLLTGFGNEEPYIDKLLKKYSGRISNTKVFALKNRVLLLQSEKGIGIDIALAGLPFEEQVIERATKFKFTANISLLTCSAEDLVIFKAFADRYKDWADVESIIIKQKCNLQWKYIYEHLTELCEIKGAPEIVTKLKKLQKENRK